VAPGRHKIIWRMKKSAGGPHWKAEVSAHLKDVIATDGASLGAELPGVLPIESLLSRSVLKTKQLSEEHGEEWFEAEVGQLPRLSNLFGRHEYKRLEGLRRSVCVCIRGLRLLLQ